MGDLSVNDDTSNYDTEENASHASTPINYSFDSTFGGNTPDRRADDDEYDEYEENDDEIDDEIVNKREELKTNTKSTIKNLVNNFNLHLPTKPWEFAKIQPRTLFNIWKTISFLVVFILGLFFSSTEDMSLAWQAFKEGRFFVQKYLNFN